MRLLVFGLGYTGAAIARSAEGFVVSGTVRADFADAHDTVAAATHLLSTVPPDQTGDPVLARYAEAIAAAANLRWIGYLSSTGVYGDRGGAAVDEATAPAPSSDRGRRRLAAEQAWAQFADRRAVDIFRLAGIYGPAARRSTNCVPARRGVSSGRATYSAGSIATTSRGRFWRRCARNLSPASGC